MFVHTILVLVASLAMSALAGCSAAVPALASVPPVSETALAALSEEPADCCLQVVRCDECDACPEGVCCLVECDNGEECCLVACEAGPPCSPDGCGG